MQALLEQEIEKCCSHMMRLDELQEDLNKEREKSNEMETEHAEQLKKVRLTISSLLKTSTIKDLRKGDFKYSYTHSKKNVAMLLFMMQNGIL